MNKEEADNFVKLCLNNFDDIKTKEEYVSIMCNIDIHKLWYWINQNYISREEILGLECLVNEDWDIDFPGEEEYEGITRDKLRNEIKEAIKKL